MLKLEDYVNGLGKTVFMDPSSIRGLGYSVFGKVYYVDKENGSDDSDGITAGTAFATVSKAYASVTSNNNDVIVLSTNGSHAVSAMITTAKNRVTFIGADFTGRKYGQAARISLGVTTAATDIAALKDTGVRNTFVNIKVSNNNTKAESLYGIVDAGEYALYDHVEMYKSTHLSNTGAAELLLEGDSSQFNNCTLGSLANALSGAVSRPCVLIDKNIVSGKVARDCSFNSCNFWRKAGNAANVFVKLVANGDAERLIEFNDCKFINNPLGTTMTEAIHSAAGNNTALLLFNNCVSYNATNFCGDTNNGLVFAYGTSTVGTTVGMSVQVSAT